jgi:hypothetical protein
MVAASGIALLAMTLVLLKIRAAASSQRHSLFFEAPDSCQQA